MVTLVAGSLGLLVLLEIVTNLMWVEYSNQKIAESNKRTMEYCVRVIEAELEKADTALMGLVASDPDYNILFNGAGPLQAHVSSQDLIWKMSEYQRINSVCDGFLVYSEPSDSCRSIFEGSDYSYAHKKKIEGWVRDTVAEGEASYGDGWRTYAIDGTGYLVRFYGGRGTYLVALASFESLKDIGFYPDRQAEISFCTDDGSEVYGSHSDADLVGILAEENYSIVGNPRWMVLHTGLAGTDVNLLLWVEHSALLNETSATQISLIVLLLYSIIMVSQLLVWVHHAVVCPLEQLEETMADIRSGNMEAVVPEFDVEEFNEVGDTFNKMMERIHNLKMESYEKELRIQKAQQQYLQLQIRPHFYLNCLKELYAIAEQKDTGRIQSFILSISGHLRYIFHDQEELVPLREELEHIRHYIDIQMQSSAYRVECRMQVPEELEDFPIPPLTLSTFVENSCKHRPDGGKMTVIRVKAEKLENETERYVVLTVQDNGDGFSEKVLKEINKKEDTKIYESNHVGIRNIRQRFRLIYGDSVMFAFYNAPNGSGSVSEIYIPLNGKEDEGHDGSDS
ncbi:MAG: histidine kinase [Eubacteriales bacterium]|nr:histidine kinase [Eubacteriales bacterium]